MVVRYWRRRPPLYKVGQRLQVFRQNPWGGYRRDVIGLIGTVGSMSELAAHYLEPQYTLFSGTGDDMRADMVFESEAEALCCHCSTYPTHKWLGLFFCAPHAAAAYVREAFERPTERPELLYG